MKKAIFTFILFVSTLILFGQAPDSTYYPWKSKLLKGNSDYYIIEDSALLYFSGKTDSAIKREYKFFNRSDYFWSNRVGYPGHAEDGTINAYSKAINDNILNYSICDGNFNNSNWQYTGPVEPYNINQMGTNQIGIVNAICSPSYNIIYAGTNTSGVWKTTDGGETWECKTNSLRVPGLGIQYIVSDKEDNQILLAATGITTYGRSYSVGIIKSTDAGETWTVANFPINNQAVEDKFIVNKIIQANDTTSNFFAVAGLNIYKSTDHGSNWFSLPTSLPTPSNPTMTLTDIEIIYQNGAKTMYVAGMIDNFGEGGGAELWRSTDNGHTWINIQNNFSNVSLLKFLNNGNFENGFSPWAQTPAGVWEIATEGSNHFAKSIYTTENSISLRHVVTGLNTGENYTLKFNTQLPANTTLNIYFTFPGDVEQHLPSIQNTSGSIQSFNPEIDFNLLVNNGSHPINIFFKYSGPDGVFSNSVVTLDNVDIYYTRPPEGYISERIELSVPTININKIWALFYWSKNSIGLTQYSEDGGNTWTPFFEGRGLTVSKWCMTYEVSPYTGKSYIGGTDFQRIAAYGEIIDGIEALHVDSRALQIVNNGGSDNLILGSDGGVSKWDGSHWFSKNGSNADIDKRLNITQIYGMDISQNGDRIIAGTQDNSTYFFKDNVWTVNWGGDGGRSIINYNDIDSVYGFDNWTLVYSKVFGGGQGQSYSAPGLGPNNWRLDMPLVQDEDKSNVFYFGGKDVYKTTDIFEESDWGLISSVASVPHAGWVSAIAVARGSNGDVICFSDYLPAKAEENGANPNNKRKLYLTTNGGTSWTDITNSILCNAVKDAAITDIIFDPNDAQHQTIWVTLNQSIIDPLKTPPYNGKYRVMKTTDGGDTWTDRSDGLPCVPVNKIIYQDGTDEGFYAGTDVGVFTWNKAQGKWECYCNSGFPVAIITDLKIDYCNQKLIASTFGRGIWKSDLANFANIPGYQYTQIITTNQTWASDKFLGNNLCIEQGATLTIASSCTLKISKDSKISVRPGGKLIIDGGKLTNGCNNSLWQGIELNGNSTLSQYPQFVGGNWVWDQGRVQIINGGTIENAVCGIKTIYSQAHDPSATTGGIIYAVGATFRNCKTAIEFMPYQNHHPTYNNLKLANFSLISQCTFETDDNLYAQGEEPIAFISLAGVQGVKISGNAFSNTTTQNYNKRGIGILSTYSSFDLLPVCTSQVYPCPEESYIENTFNGLQYGVWASSPASQFNIQIKNCIFTHNFGSILLNGITSAEVIDNSIDVGPRSYSGDAPWDMSYGLMLEQCTGYTIEENQFSTFDNGSYGVIVRNSGSFPNMIYKNTFNGSIVPFHVEGTNGFSSMILRSDNGDIALPAFSSGLVLKCNDFQVTNTLWDIEIPGGSISPFQGSSENDQTPAGNQFDHSVDPYLGRIAVNYNVSPFTYFHHSDQIMTPYISQFFNSYHVITKYPCGAMSANTCLSNSSNCDPGCLINNINLYSTVLAPWNNQIIQGNNQSLLNRVFTANTAGGISFAALRDTLLNVSPYVSDTILIAAIEKYDTLEPVMLKDVMVANSPLTYKVKTVLDTKALSDRIKQAIDSVQNGISARNELEAKISDTSMLMGLAENELIRQYMKDTTIVGIDSVISYFLAKKDNISRKTLVQAYYSKGDSSNLISALDSLRLQTNEDTLFKEFYTLLADFCTNKNLLYDIDSIQELTIRNIATSKTEAAVYAQTVLAMVYNEIPSIELEKIYIPDRLSIYGYLKSDSLCSGLPLAGDTIFLLDADTSRLTFITPVITDSAGYFAFYLPELLQLSDTATYGFGTTYASPVKNFELKTISQWLAASPLNLTLRKTEADFVFDTIRCYNDSIHFTSIITGGKKPYTYLWDFGNDSVSTSPNPAMLFDTTGAYNVTLVVSSADGCTDTIDKTVIVNPLPEITITTSDSTICNGDSTTLTASGGASYLWNTSDTTAVISFAPELTITCTVTVTSADGCTNTASTTITVNPLPTAAINSSDSTICAGDSATLTASGGATYLWNTADTTAANIVVPITTTTYTVTVTSTEGCSNTESFAITVNPLPTAAINSSDSTICAGDSASLTASGGATYLWNTADTAAAITVVPDSTTTYTVTVTSAEGCNASDTATITIDCANITGRTMYAGKANVNTAPNPPTYDSRNYDINKEIVILKNQSGTEIARDTSDANGAFSFTDVDNGTYTLFYDKYTADTMQWCDGVNTADLSMIMYLIGSDTTTDPSRNFSRIYKKAANVDNNSMINSTDKARIQAKIGAPNDPAKNFPKGNWVNLDTTITVNGSNLNFTIPVISYGDYNASSSKYRDSANTWSQVKSLTDENIITISDESLILNNTGLIEIPLRISSSLNDFAAMGLELYYPKEKFKLVSASMPNTSDSNGVFKINPTLQEIIEHNDDLLVTDDSGIIRVVFATTNIFDVANNDIMINLGFQPLHELEPGEIEFKLFGTGMIADQYGTEAKANEYLLVPKIFVQGNQSEAGFDFTGYPNPFNGSTTLTYNLPENGTVKLRVYNVLGICVSELVNETQLSGKHSLVFSAKNQPAGMYTFRLDYTGAKDSNCAVLKMIYY